MLDAQPEVAKVEPQLQMLAELDVYFVDTEHGTFGQVHDVWLMIDRVRLDTWLPVDPDAVFVLDHLPGRGAWCPSGPGLRYCGPQILTDRWGPAISLPTTHGTHRLVPARQYAIRYVPSTENAAVKWGSWLLSEVLAGPVT